MESILPIGTDKEDTSQTKDEALKKTARTRVWRACETCRKRKIKCDGQNPCQFCKSNGKECKWPQINDHAAGSRQQLSYLEHRLASVEAALDSRVTSLEQDILPFIASLRTLLQQDGLAVPKKEADDVVEHATRLLELATPLPKELPDSSAVAAASGGSVPSVFSNGGASVSGANGPNMPREAPEPSLSQAQSLPPPAPAAFNKKRPRTRYTPSAYVQTLMQPAESAAPDGPSEHTDLQFSRDSLGNLRYIGGASSFVLAEALRAIKATPPAATVNTDLPFYRPGMHFRRFQALPLPESTKLPEPAMADALVEAYFAHFHAVFPILDENAFVSRYAATMEAHLRGEPLKDHAFLASLFAVFACAESLKKPKPPAGSANANFRFTVPAEYAGLEFYERAQILFWIGFRAISIEHVQCLGLLAMCLAGWNALGNAWILAGQAIRAGQDLGLHRMAPFPAQKTLRNHIWWCTYTLDRILSISLGRPGATHDDDCDAEIPTHSPEFTCFCRINVIAGRIVRSAHSASVLRNKSENQVGQLIASLDHMLETWVNTLPDNVKFAIQRPDNTTNLPLCLMSFLVYYSAIINLHRPFIPEADTDDISSLVKCVTAAKCCIKIGTMVRRVVPNSHLLAYAIQYITISGVVLLRIVGHTTDPALVAQTFEDAEKCISLLRAMESDWPGARRCREIISDLLFITKRNFNSHKRGREGEGEGEAGEGGGAGDANHTSSVAPSTRTTFAPPDAVAPRTDYAAPLHPPHAPLTSPLAYDEQVSPRNPQYPSPSTAFDFDVSSFAVGNTADSLPYGFDFLGGDLASILDHSYVPHGAAPTELSQPSPVPAALQNHNPFVSRLQQQNASGKSTPEANAQALWDALLQSDNL